MDKIIDIGGKIIGRGKSIFIIAEAGVNHNGSLKIAKRLVDVSKQCGADAVKFQTYTTGNLILENTDPAPYQQKNADCPKSQFDMLKQYELTNKQFFILKKYCDKKGILFLSTPHTEDSVDFLDTLVPLYKIGSGDITNIPLLKKIASKNKPIILSTGMSTLDEIREALSALHSKVILMHCTTSYPCPEKDVNLNVLKTLEKEFDCLIGYSDHTLGTKAFLMAAKLGAVALEKHLTVDKKLKGPDHKSSATRQELRVAIKKIRRLTHFNQKLDEKILGSFEKKPTEDELQIMRFIRKSIVTTRDITKGDIFGPHNLSIKRPGTGVSPKEYYNIAQEKRAACDIKKDSILLSEMIEGGLQ